MPGGKFNLPKSPENQALAAAAASRGIPAPGASPAPNDILALLKSGGMDEQTIMMILAMLAGMGPQGVPGQMPQQGAEMGGGQNPIEAAYGGGGGGGY